jgi:glutathione peroxidase
VPPWLRLRRSSSDGADRSNPDAAAADAVRRACAAHGLASPALRVLARADVNGARASPVWTFLKAAYGDTSDIGWNFGKFVMARDGNVVGRYCPPLRPALLVRAACFVAADARDAAPTACMPRDLNAPFVSFGGSARRLLCFGR